MAVGHLGFHAVGALLWRDESWMLWRKTDPSLFWQRGCRSLHNDVTGFSGGAYEVYDADGDVMRVRHTGCERVELTYNGDIL